MGAVWLGRDEVLGRQVALKKIGLLQGTDSTDLARAEREARLSARLNHPHVVAVFNFVVDADTADRWLVMEYVDGMTLGQLVKERGKLSPEDAAPLLWQAADALVAAHSAGIVHRDVKPSNILVDADQRVKLTDFGIARIATDPSLTQTGLIIGSPTYLAPEVATGERGNEAADVWSMGATMFHVLSGQPPYEVGDHPLNTLFRIVHDEPPRLADAGSMTPLLEATMVKDPSRRWSMAQVRDFLAEPAGRVVPAAGGGEPDRTAVLSSTRVLGPVGHTAASDPGASPAPTRRGLVSPRNGILAGLAALALVLAVVLYVALNDMEPTADTAAPSPSASPSVTETSKDAEPPRPTEAGMKTFIRDYVAALSTDPDVAWQMLTPKFQRDSGGLDNYRAFWGGAGTGEVLNISADPGTLAVSYQVRFSNREQRPGRTMLDLVFQRGRYLINAESSRGFEPAG